MSENQRASQVLDELSAKVKPSDLDKLDDSFVERVERLAAEKKLDAATVTRLHVMWKMLKAPEDAVPWSKKAILMAAVAYFASPFDLIPDFAGSKGYADDSLIIRLAFDRLGDATKSFVEPA